MAGALGRSATVVYLGVVLVLLLGWATPASSLVVNTSNPSACSSACESAHCKDPATLRYGKYCGIGYTGCSGQTYCDDLDLCCQTHDSCIGSNLQNYLNRTCNENLKTCATNFKNSNQPQFTEANCSRSDVSDVIIAVADVATLGNHGSPSSPINLAWAILSMFVMSVVLFGS